MKQGLAPRIADQTDPQVFCEDQRTAGRSMPDVLTSARQDSIRVWSFGPTSARHILAAYTQLNSAVNSAAAIKDFCRALRGDTSFVLYDAGRERLVAVRDFFGVYPLFYAMPPQRDAGAHPLPVFGFSITALLHAKVVRPEPNPAKIAEYLDWRARDQPVNTQTFYKQVHRLLPGHVYIVEPAGTIITPYRKLSLDKHASLADEEYIRRFRRVFLQAAQRHVAADTSVAVTLSGGLDSSVVCGVAQSISTVPVHSFYIDPAIQDAQEASYAHAVHVKWHTRHHVDVPQASVYGSIVRVIEATAEPERGVLPLSFHWPAIETAANEACQVLLTGQGGDQVVGFGYEYLDECYAARDWPRLKKAIRQLTQYRSADLAYLFPRWAAKSAEAKTQLYAARFFLRKLKHTKQVRPWIRQLMVLATQFGLPVVGLSEVLQRKITTKIRPRKQPLPHHLIRADFAAGCAGPGLDQHAGQRLDVAQLLDGTPTAAQQDHVRICFSNQAVSIMEEWSQILAANGLKAGHPFLDPDVLELTLATPTKLRFADGLGRGVLRQALTDYLPEMVARRASKSEFSAYGHQGLKNLLTEFQARTATDHQIWCVVDRDAFEATVDLVLSERYIPRLAYAHVWTLLRVINLAAWFDYVDRLTPVSPSARTGI